MFKIESYVTPILLSYVDKYVRDFKPADAQVSLWAGGVALHNLILKADVLQQEVSLPFTLISGRIHELLIQVPWTKIMSEPITVAIDTIECILSFRPPVCDENVMTETTSRTTQVVEAPPGYMQALVRRIVSNITVKVHHLIVKYVQDDVVLSLNVKHLTVESAGPDWKPAFADIDQNEPVIRRIVTLDDLTLCLDQSDDDGKIRFYQEPLLYRCQLSLKVLTKLVTAPVRRAKSINMQLSSSKLAWSITNEQLALILRLIKEHERFVAENNPIVFNKSATASTTGSQSSQTTSTEPHKDTSWSEWAWSWMPSWGGESTANDTPRMTPTHATHVYLSAYLDEICLIFKVMETEIGGRKRPRGMLELCADYLAFKSYVKRPVQVRAKFGLRNLLIKSHGKCTCGHMNSNTLNGIPTVYLKRRLSLPDADWNWPGDNLEDDKIDSEDIPQFEPKRKSGFSTDPDNRQSSSKPAAQTDVQETENKLEKKEPLQKEVVLEEKPDDTGGTKQVETPTDNKLIDNEETESDSAPQLNFARAGNLSDLVTSEPSKETKSEKYDPPKDLWHLMDPLVLVEYSHERGPPMYHQNPFENPPTDFEYSDWEEDCIIKVVVKPLDFRLCMGFIHRATTVFDIFDKVKMPTVDPLVRTLTVEECDALLDNLPQRRINVEITDFRIRLHPWDHLPVEKPLKLPIVLDLVVPKATCAINGPLYAHRVCSAACQIPQDSGPLWLGARQHITVALNSMLIQICPIDTDQPKPCARFDLRCVMHVLLFPEYFTQRQSVTFSYSAQIREINISGSAARLQAALQIVYSLLTQKGSLYLRQTSLAKDALNDEGEVVLDVTFEDIILRGYFTKFITSQMLTLQALRATVIHEHEGVSKQAWVVAGPDNPSSTAFFRCAFQWASEPMVTALDYLGIWVEPLALSLDPLFVQWLGYRPLIITQPESSSQPLLHKTISSSAYLNSRRRTTPPSSSGRGGSRTGSGQEQVHIRGRSIDSSSEPSEKKYAPKRNSKEKQQPGKQQLPWWKGERVLKLHSRLKHMLISIETGIILLYVTTTSVPAVNCPTVLLAMEQHASEDQQVLVFSLGRWSLHTNSTTKYLWQDVKHDGPTFIDAKTATEEESFPWKMKIADMSCYTFAAKVEPSPSDKAKGLKSQLKPTRAIQTITIVSLFTTSVTFSVLTKSLQYVVHNPKDQATSTKREPPKDEAVLKYFSSGVDFKPTSLMEFMRGPPKRSKAKEAEHEVKKEVKPGPVQREQIIMGPMVSIGFQWHADTPPILIKLDQEQLHIFSTSLHCIQHFITLLKFTPVRVPRYHGYSYLGFSSVRDVKVGVENPELDMLSESDEDSKSDLISIFESKPDQQDTTLKTFVWFQWVISRATLTVTSFQVKITVELDDIISTIDLQEHYNQFRMKIENFTILHHQRNEDDEWVVGPLYGRVVEVREPANAQEASHFLALTITQASLSNLPPSWKEELHPKLLDPKINPDIMWEIYANIMPLEVIIQPSVFEHFLRVMHLLTSHSTCTEGREPIRKPINMWPFVYISAGGVRVIITEQKESLEKDDTFVINVGRIVVNPHPDNPICRKPINVAMDSTWTQASDGFEGRQYEMQIKSITVKTGLFQSIIAEEESEYPSKHPNIGQNPARKWSRTQGLVLTPVVHTISVSCVVAPPLYIGLTLQCGTGIEINLTSDCLVEINLDQIALMYNITEDLKYYYEYCLRSAYYESEREEKCPYEELLKPRVVPDASAVQSQTNLPEGSSRPLYNTTDTGVAPGTDIKNDSGLDSRSRSSTSANVTSLFKKTVSIGLIERGVVDPLEYLEVFVTVGSVEMSLYTLCETSNSPPKTDTTTARHYKLPDLKSDTEDATPDSPGTSPKIIHNSPPQRTGSIRSLTETVRHADKGQSALNINQFANFAARRSDGSVALMNITFYQPNLYYWRKKTVKNLQISLFNLWVGLGSGFLGGNWTAVLLSTARGVPDPLTDIPPALFTMRLVTSSSASTINSRGSLTVDFERPILVELCEERLARIKDMCDYFKEKYSKVVNGAETTNTPFLYKIRQFMQNKGIETVTIHTTQIGVQFLEGIVGWDSTSIQLGWNARPERLVIRSLISAFLIAVGPPCDNRRQILQPLHAGMLLEAMWEIWRRSEGRMSAREPSVRVCIDLDKITVDLRPSDLETIANLQKSMKTVFHKKVENETDSEDSCECCSQEKLMDECAINEEQRLSMASVEFAECNVGSDRGGNHFYKDDLRTGAFKIVSGGQLPMAYQVSLHRSIVSWRYPHPRAITRLILFPLPGMSTETDCVLELFNRQAREWKPHTYVKIPVNEPREVRLFIPSPEAVFCTTWRFRVYSSDEKKQNYEFDIKSYTPRPDPLVSDPVPETELKETNVTAEMLSGVLRVDSYFSPRLLPRIRVTVRLASAHIHAHNSLPKIHSNQSSVLEGYYVTKPLMRTHRVLTIGIQNMDTDFYFASPAGSLLLMSSELSSDIIDCATGILVPLVTPFSAQMAISVPKGQTSSRLRFCSSVIHASLHIPCIRTLSIVVSDWQEAKNKYFPKHTSAIRIVDPMKAKKEAESDVVDTLEGRVSLWIHNSCTFSVRVGQEGTDELVPLGPGAKLAYRWRCPAAPRRLRFAIASPSTEWRWSNSVKFVPSTRRVRLEDLETMDSSIATPGCGVFLYIKIDQQGATRQMRLTGRLMLANMLRFNLLFKIRAHFKELNQWRTVASGELTAETIGRSVICAANCELVLKIRLMNHETGWSGDIPLKECPKENVPWLVKVPSDGDVPFISVWCRVNRARSDGRILATIWPLYVLRSHLPLDTDVLIATEMDVQAPQSSSWSESRPPPLIHTAPGRGTSTHLMAPGTTSARHTLSFQYRNIECPVTREAVPLHYGVTDSSVFDKRPPVNNLEEVVVEINNWLERAGRNSTSNWPYSVVTSHWPGMWQPTLLQPRCEVAVRYEAVRAGGGCSLEVQISPVLLLCNASPIALTLRAHDAAPLCKLEPGSAISPSSAMLKKPFFMSVEVGRETFVSRQLKVTSKDPGRYGTPPPGELALDHAVTFAVQCSQKVALLTMHYEIKEDINVLGITATYMLVNRLDTDLLVSPIAIPRETDSDRLGLKRGSVRHKNLKLIPPTPSGTIQGVPLCRLWLMGRWRGREASDLRLYLYVSFAGPSGGNMRPSPVDELIPIQLGTAPLRRAISLRNIHGVSVPVVVTQQKHDGRWLISVARDPCPQYALLNNTPTDIAVAQPAQIVEEASTSAITVVPDCEGVEWLCTVKPKSLTHYSTPAHCARHPPTTETTANVPFLTFTQIYNENYHSGWCAPVAVTEGEQLVQLYHGSTIKLRVRVHPHSTYIELREVDDNDISASDIRRRLVEPETSASYDDNVYSREPAVKIEDKYLERVDADEKLLNDVENDSQDDTFALDIRGSLNEDDFVCTNDRIQVINLEKEVSHVKDNQQVKVTEDNEMIDEEIHKDKGEDIIEKNEEKDEKQFTNVKVVETLVLNDATLLALSQERPIKIPSLIDDLEGADEVKAIKLPLQEDILSAMTVTRTEDYSSELSSVYYGCEAMDDRPVENERVRAMIAGVIVDLAASSDSHPLLAVHLDRVVTLLTTQTKKIKTTVSIGDIQIDNLQYDSGQYDFAVIATTRDDRLEPDPWPPIMNMFVERNTFATKSDSARFLLKVCNDQWTIGSLEYNEITEVDIRGGPLALYVEDAYVKALAELFKLILPTQSSDSVAQALAEANTLQNPIRLRCLLIHPLDLTLTLHTAVRMYIALDQSPLHLSAFKLHNIVTSTERLVHALTVHYLSAAILGAGWVVGGLELLGAPGALAARVGGATGGVRGIASAAAAGLLRSLSAWAGSLARNLDLLAGDEEHARRAAAARRRPPDSLAAGLVAGITNFAINILGAVGGLAHHPLVGVAVGETESGATALRRGLLGALTKPLSATADLVAYAGHGLLKQTGWDPVPQPRSVWAPAELQGPSWERDCVRWTFRMAELTVHAGFEVLIDNSLHQILLTSKYIVVAEIDSERIIEMIDMRFCTLSPYEGPIIELHVKQRRQSKAPTETKTDDNDEVQVTAAAMARVARYTGAEVVASTSANTGDLRVLTLLPTPGQSYALHCALAALIHSNADTHFHLL